MEFYNSVQKMDLNGEIYKGVIFDQPIVRIGEMGQIKRNKGYSKVIDEEENKKRSIRRAKTNVSDYVQTNVDLQYFVTYTLDSQKINRYDEDLIYRRTRDWLSNSVKRKEFKYVLVPEKHKDGAWHFHGFTNKDLEWKYGFSKIVEIKGEKKKIINYATNYISKDSVKFNGRYYLHSKNLVKPVKIYDNVDFENEEGYCCEIENLGVKIKIQG